MNFTVNNLRKLEFKKSFRGYKEDSVNLVLDQIIDDYQRMELENRELKERVDIFKENLDQYKLVEASLKNALVVAQQTAEEIKLNAHEKADMILSDAESTARQMVNEANERVLTINIQFENMKKEVSVFKAKVESLFLSQLELLRESVKECLSANEKDKGLEEEN
jgi:cell division initiation protein